uniref:NADH dehydrogenase subunit 4 n=1 Tax=Amblyomma neumanni TaxID=251388 RepID=UPI002E76AB11|nr:NADH dehydrogenase subunit 4 [Amblyomma neumanni]WQF69052.1 NADH dehydrogenase subunit 4 [Amblyomma neumanni]
MLISVFMSFMIMCMSFFFTSYEMLLLIVLMMLVFYSHFLMKSELLVMEIFSIDLMSFLLILLTFWVSFLMILASFYNQVFLNKNFVFYVNLMMFLLVICFSVSNLLAFYFFFESILFPIVMMIFGWGNQPERLQAGFYMLMYTIFGSFPMFVMMMWYSVNNYTLNYCYMDWLSKSMGIFFIFLMLGFFVKIPMFLFHLWLPKAHVEAPISGSMILAGVLLKLGIYGIYRFKMMIINDVMFFCEILMIVSIWGSVMISIFCLYQVDIKSLIAYSSVCHMGVVLSGTMSFFSFSSLGSLLLMVGHGLCSSGLFCLANLVYERVFTRSMMLFKGIKLIFPSLTLWWFLFSIVNMSAPLTMNLFGEFFLSLSILKISIFFFTPLMMIIFLSACYSIYMYSYINHGKGWICYSLKMISLREFNVLLLHFFPLILWVFKISMFCKWV